MKEYSADKSGAPQKDAERPSTSHGAGERGPGELNPAGGEGKLAGSAWQFGRQGGPSKAGGREAGAPATRSPRQEAAMRHLNAKLVSKLLRSTGIDLSHVLLSTDPSLAEQGKVGAAVEGREIKVAPGNEENEEVLAHEAGHIIQQMPMGVRAAREASPKEGAGSIEGQETAPVIGEPGGSGPSGEAKGLEQDVDLEAEADSVAAAVLAGEAVEVRGVGSGVLYEERTEGCAQGHSDAGAGHESQPDDLDRGNQDSRQDKTSQEFGGFGTSGGNGYADPMEAARFGHPGAMAMLQSGGLNGLPQPAVDPTVEGRPNEAQELGTLANIAPDVAQQIANATQTEVASVQVVVDPSLVQSGHRAVARSGREIGLASADLSRDTQLLAHEAAHIAQQRNPGPGGVEPEAEANKIASAALNGEQVQILGKAKATMHEGEPAEPETTKVTLKAEKRIAERQKIALKSFTEVQLFANKGAVQVNMNEWLKTFRAAWVVDQANVLKWFTGEQDTGVRTVLHGTHADTSVDNTLAKAKTFDEALDVNALDVRRVLLRAALEARSQFESMRAAMAKSIELAKAAELLAEATFSVGKQALTEGKLDIAPLGDATQKAGEYNREVIPIAGVNSGYRPASAQESPWVDRHGLGSKEGESKEDEEERLEKRASKLSRKDGETSNPRAQKVQKGIIEGGKAAPGTSRHGFGFEFDIGAIDNAAFDPADAKKPKDGEEAKAPKFQPEFEWLKAQAWRYGFFRPYTDKTFPDAAASYGKENWHWSYYPAAQAFHQLVTDNIGDFDTYLKSYWDGLEEKNKHGKKPDLSSFVADVWRDLHTSIDDGGIPEG